MRILYLMQYFSTPQGSYGTRTYEFARRLVARGHEVILITTNTMMPDYKSVNQVTKVTIDDITCIVIPAPALYAKGISFKQRVVSYIKFSIAALQQISHHPADVIIASSPPLPISISGIWAKVKHHAPMVFEVRDLWPEMPIAVGALNNPLLRVLARALEWISYRASSHVIALSPGMAEGVASRGIKDNRISMIPNSCDIEFFAQTSCPERIREQIGIRVNDPLVVYVGAFGLLNDVTYLVDIAYHMRSINPDVHFLMVGQGVKWDTVAQKAEQLGLLDVNFHLWAPVPKTTVPDLLAAATIVTSLFIPLEPMWKNSANKFFDGLAASKPIAINYGGWHADLIQENDIGLAMNPYDPHRAAKQLAEFISNPERLQRASRAASTLAHTQFSRDQTFNQLEEVLSTVVQRQ